MSIPALRLGGIVLLAALLTGAAQAQSPILKEIEAAFVRLHEDVGPSVVNIETSGPLEERGGAPDFFHFFGIPAPEGGQSPQVPRPMRPQATGCGFIFSADGYIVTNNHVVDGSESIKVRLWNGNEYPAEVVGQDLETDLAIIKIVPTEDLIAARLGDSDSLKVGQFAIAIGSPRGFEGSVSFGHISALGRENLGGLTNQGLQFQNLIQTDAAINLGNSGGPLCNLSGEVIGINTAILWGANSIGFAIPINTAKIVVPQLIEAGKVVRGYLGVGISDARDVASALELPDRYGAFVERVEEQSPAAEVDIRTYDVIRSVNGKRVNSASDLVSQIAELPPGTKVSLQVWRDQKLMDKEAVLAERPAPNAQRASSTPPQREVLGMSLTNLTTEIAGRLGLEEGTEGVLVTGVAPGSPAEEAGLAQGDIIIEFAQRPVKTVNDLRAVLDEVGAPGKSLLVRHLREGSRPIKVIKIPE